MMRVEWFKYWGLKCNPFSPLELSYLRGEDFDRKFVSIPAAREVEQLLEELRLSDVGGAHIIEGAFGAGKSTLLNYIARFLEKNISEMCMIPVFVKLTRLTSISNVRECEEVIENQMVKGLHAAIRRYISDSDLIDKTTRRPFDEIERCITFLEERGYRAVFLIDELDKMEERIAKSYMSKYQPTGEILWKRGHITFWTINVNWKLHQDRRFSFIHKRILIQRWFQPDIEKLLDRRIKAACPDNEEEKGVDDIFEREALNEIYLISEGYPREAQAIAELSMKYAADFKKTKVTADIVSEVHSLESERYLHERMLSALFRLITQKGELHKLYNSLINIIREDPTAVNTIVHFIVETVGRRRKVHRSDLPPIAIKHLNKLEREGLIRKIGRAGSCSYVPVAASEDLFKKLFEIALNEANRSLRMYKRRRGAIAEIEKMNWIKDKLKRFFAYLVTYRY